MDKPRMETVSCPTQFWRMCLPQRQWNQHHRSLKATQQRITTLMNQYSNTSMCRHALPTNQFTRGSFSEKAPRYFNQDKPTYVIPTGDAPLWESSDELLLSKLWPHLDPFGLVGVYVERDVKISLDEQVKHWLNPYDSDVRCDPSFPFIISNMLRRRDVFRHLAFRVPKEKVARIAAALLEIYRISTVFWRFVQAHTYFNQTKQAPHARFQFVPHRIRVHGQGQAPLHASHAYNQLNSCMGKLI
ncbi:BZ3500_MvSof-1268-A1-R1_Chr8-2g10266 [Microbotryum saponariae]|uniref:BZ3500_MvSof-1268-A1-R1_Chr8-2g10266 protein n=1 Tax=Microbotryum saponariae TaxID=289078 RepID=A0A2X0L5Z1_9BASI|nr:BZ3500_MvSof-1268-A1-R1_Chr8-2g10266 [Microbotryum saponariae]SDA02064.1 BZ3501_MvSof-1269-A2-R1_Chr8-2g10016 [Microbotryum saponariae]